MYHAAARLTALMQRRSGGQEKVAEFWYSYNYSPRAKRSGAGRQAARLGHAINQKAGSMTNEKLVDFLSRFVPGIVFLLVARKAPRNSIFGPERVTRAGFWFLGFIAVVAPLWRLFSP